MENHFISIKHKGTDYRFYGRDRWEFWTDGRWVPINGIYIHADILRAVVNHPDFVIGPKS